MKKKFILIFLVILLVVLFIFIYKLLDSNPYFFEKKISEYNNPIIPSGFEKIETENASWELNEDGIPTGCNNGLVIEDENGNQFVWVPVDGNNVSYQIDKVNNMSHDILTYTTHLPNGITNEYLQIVKYGGFYVGRYEAGLPEEMQEIKEGYSIATNNIISTPVVKKNCIAWNKINASYAIESSELLYNTDTVKSGLITLSQWYTLMEWIENSGYNTNTDSKDWGNYSNVNFLFNGWYSTDDGQNYSYAVEKNKAVENMLLSTGASDRNMANNIYDLAGNLCEYTSTYSWAYTFVYAGGYYDNTGLDYANNISLYYDVNSKIGFRVVLFIQQ